MFLFACWLLKITASIMVSRYCKVTNKMARTRRYEEKPAGCTIGSLLELLARPWTMHILWMLSTNGPTRFGELRRQIGGVSSRVLTERLRTLEQKGFVFRKYEPT